MSNTSRQPWRNGRGVGVLCKFCAERRVFFCSFLTERWGLLAAKSADRLKFLFDMRTSAVAAKCTRGRAAFAGWLRIASQRRLAASHDFLCMSQKRADRRRASFLRQVSGLVIFLFSDVFFSIFYTGSILLRLSLVTPHCSRQPRLLHDFTTIYTIGL